MMVLDAPIVGGNSEYLSHLLLGFSSSERKEAEKIFDTLDTWVMQLLGQEQGSTDFGNSIAKLSRGATEPFRGERAAERQRSDKSEMSSGRKSLASSLGLGALDIPHNSRIDSRVEGVSVGVDGVGKVQDFLSQAALNRKEDAAAVPSLAGRLETPGSRRESGTSNDDKRPADNLVVSVPSTPLAAALGLPLKSRKQEAASPSFSPQPSIASQTSTKENRSDELRSIVGKQPLDPVESDEESDASMMEDETPSRPSSPALTKEPEVREGAEGNKALKEGTAGRWSKTSKDSSKTSKDESSRQASNSQSLEVTAGEVIQEKTAQDKALYRWDGSERSSLPSIGEDVMANRLSTPSPPCSRQESPAQKKLHCPQCGAELGASWKFCDECGAGVAQVNQSGSEDERRQAAAKLALIPLSSPASQRKSNRSESLPTPTLAPPPNLAILPKSGELPIRLLRRANTSQQEELFHKRLENSGDRPNRRSPSLPCASTIELSEHWTSTVPRIQLTDLSQNGSSPKATRFMLPEKIDGDQPSDSDIPATPIGSNSEDPSNWHKSASQSKTGSTDRIARQGYEATVSDIKLKGFASHRRTALKKPHRRAAVTGMLAGMVLKENLEEDQASYLGMPTHRFIINPSSGGRMGWDTIALVIILMESVVLPLGLAFNVYPPDGVMWISTAFFLPDIVLNFCTGFYHNGMLIMRQKIIVKRYMFGWFLIDFPSTVPWEVLLSSDQGQASFFLKFAKIGKLMRVLRLLRVLKLKALLQRFEDMFTSYIVLFTISVAKTVMIYVLFCHWCGCVWGWLGSHDGELGIYNRADCEPDGPCEHGIGIDDSPWRRRYALDDSPPMAQYLTSLQFATGLLTGSDLQLMPGNWPERLFVTIMMIVSFLVCSMIISQIVVVMEKINQDNSEYLEHTRIIRDFMVSRGMPMRLQTKVKRYLEYQFKSRKVVHQNHEILRKLSPFLRIEIQDHMNKAILEHHPFFAGMEASIFSEVCCLARSVLYAPGDVVMRKGQLTSLICFIVRGQLMIKDAREGYSVYIKAPAWTGDRGLWVTSVRTHTVVCSMHTELLIIQQQDLIDLVKNFPAAEEYIKEYCQRVLNDDPSVMTCLYCRCSGHELDTCEELDAAINDKGDPNRRITTRATMASMHAIVGLKAGFGPFTQLMNKINGRVSKDMCATGSTESDQSRSTVRHDAYKS